MIGSILDGKYHIIRELGAGAMGAVYEAEHTGTGRRVAVKVITGALAHDQALVGRFQREARAAGAIDTKHITQVLDTGVDRESDLPFMVMEFLSGEDLQKFLKRSGPISPDLALRIMAQACLGLQKAHEAGVVHRDIKPANLFLTRSDGEIVVKILDFGIAKVKMDQAQETETAGLTRTGSMLGSPLFMSPEQARGSKTVDGRADIWSLGVSIYQALCGRTPYQHVTALGELILAICSEPAPSIQQFAPWLPPEVAAIVHGCIQQNPDHRFQHARDLLAAIKPLLPYGWGIQEEMLVPLDPSTKSHVAPQFVPVYGATHPNLSGTGPQGMSQIGHATANSAMVMAGHLVQPGVPGMGTHPGSGSNPNAASQSGLMAASGLVQSQVPVQKPSSKAPIIAGAIAAAAVVGGGVFFAFTRVTPPAPPAPVQTQAAPTPPPPPSQPTAAPAPTPAPAPPPVVEDTTLRRVKVVIVPGDAKVEVEGKLTLTKLGILELEGKLGSVHRVRVYKGIYEKIEDVIITEAGPSVPKIEMSFTPPGAKTAGTPTVPKGITKDFE